MARYAGGGKNTVEGCRSIDVLEWRRKGYLPPNLGGGCGFPLGLEEREPNGKAQYGEAGTDGQPRKH